MINDQDDLCVSYEYFGLILLDLYIPTLAQFVLLSIKCHHSYFCKSCSPVLQISLL
nr:MAG TPA: hypothetical protein [Caudoviricetes sp.]